MTQQELVMEAAKLRLRLRMNNRLKLESQALLSKLFREHEVPVADELLSCLILAVPDELLIEAQSASRSKRKPPPKPPTKNGGTHTPPPKPPPKNGGTHTPPPKPPPKNGGTHKPPPKPPPKGAVRRADVNNPPPKPPTLG